MWIYGLIFVLGSIMSLILLLNMVIGIMSMRLEEVVLDQEAYIIRERLIECMNSHHRMPKRIINKFKENKWLYVIEVDPHFDFEQQAASEE